MRPQRNWALCCFPIGHEDVLSGRLELSSGFGADGSQEIRVGRIEVILVRIGIGEHAGWAARFLVRCAEEIRTFRRQCKGCLVVSRSCLVHVQDGCRLIRADDFDLWLKIISEAPVLFD